MAVLLETSLGDIVVDLYIEERPKCSLNFLKLCKIKYYNFSLFFSVQRSFIAQAGDPVGTGEGGESLWGVLKGEDYRYFEAEKLPRIKHQKLGTLSMVNNGSGSHGSQFFITLGEELDYLDGQHTVFGEVAEGHDILMKFNEAYCDKEGRPYQDIRLYHTVVLEDPFPDPEGMKESFVTCIILTRIHMYQEEKIYHTFVFECNLFHGYNYLLVIVLYLCVLCLFLIDVFIQALKFLSVLQVHQRSSPIATALEQKKTLMTTKVYQKIRSKN